MPPDTADISALRNLGARSAGWLREDGIHTIGDLRALGAVAAFQRIRFRQPRTSRTLLRARAAGLEDRDWRSLAPAGKAARRAALPPLRA